MSLFISSLNSGSNGNCYYVGNDQDAVLIDVGLPCKELEIRIARLGLDMSKVRAIFVSHEHSDHVSGIPTLVKKYRLPVYITPATLRNGKIRFDAALINNFTAYQPIMVGGLSVTAFPKFHDACDPHSFIVTNGSVNIGVFTDIGKSCDHVISHFSRCHAAFLESNYDEVMLSSGRYPWYLKNRITSGRGHLSNTQALEIFTRYRPPFMTHLLLAHLSKENNCPNLVAELFTRHAGNTNVVVASRYAETPLYEIKASAPVTLPVAEILPQVARPFQLSLF
ncbi:MAG: MBL fold metallo-hydrolase [Chitinophagaceae bacterium]|nr:MAG: MBL fold metallo-hydrolase [Chitinophagaceae bacterium]